LDFGVFYLSSHSASRRGVCIFDSLFPCDFVVECAGVKLAGVEARHADHEAYKSKLSPPIVPKKDGKHHGACAKDKMHSHINCFLSQLVIRSEHCTSVIAKKRLELIGGDSATTREKHA
jgi:hypothetical protein